jgi:cytidylate kinase
MTLQFVHSPKTGLDSHHRYLAWFLLSTDKVFADLSIYDLVTGTGTLSEYGMFQTVKTAVNDVHHGKGSTDV